MGTVGSIESTKEETKDSRKKDIRGELLKEFGQVVEDDNKNTSSQLKINTAVFKAKRLFMKPINGAKTKENKLIIVKQNNGALLKELYRQMDPSINNLSTRSVAGEVEIAVKYKQTEKILLVKLGCAKGLSQEDMQFPNPYISASLFENINVVEADTKQTKVKKNTSNPIFQEILVFALAEEKVASSSLQISVWDKNDITQDDFLGQALIDLCTLNLNTGNSLWYKLKPQTDTSISGNIEVSLAQSPPNIIKVTVHQANGLKVSDVKNNTSHPFFRVMVTGLPSKMESNVINNSLQPVWESEYHFDVHEDEFSRRVLVINLFSKDLNGGKAMHLGDVHIPLINILSHEWNIRKSYELQDLRNTSHTRSKWSEEGISMEFKEALKAHAIYGYPKFLFKKEHSGKKVVSCYSEKAHTQAKMIISNGIPTLEEVEK